jgi:hypothetical protein
MNKITQLTDNAILVEIPESSYGLRVFNDERPYVSFYEKQLWELKNPRIYLPPGKWEPLGLSTDLTEESAQKVVDNVESERGILYGDYVHSSGGLKWFDTALESFNSLLRSKGIVDRNLLDGESYRNMQTGEMETLSGKDWQQAQQQVKKYLILIKQDL